MTYNTMTLIKTINLIFTTKLDNAVCISNLSYQA